MYWPRPLREYPPGTLDAIRSTVAALLGYQDILPADLYVKLNLFRDDLTTAINSSARPSPTFTPHATQAGRLPNQRM